MGRYTGDSIHLAGERNNMTANITYRIDALIDTPVDLREAAPLGVGTPVEVRSRFDLRWLRGFSVAVVGPEAYQLRRRSDGAVLPAWFPAAEVRQIAADS